MHQKETLYAEPIVTSPIELTEGMTALDYAIRITESQNDWRRKKHINDDQSYEVFVETVDQNFKTLIEQQPFEDIQAAKQALIEYGKSLWETKPEYRRRWPTGYLPWVLKLSELANFSKRLDIDETLNLGYAQNEQSQSSEQFWQEVYINTVKVDKAKVAFNSYVLGPKIGDKDTSILSSVVEQLQEEPTEEVLPGLPYVKPLALRRHVYDCFSNIITEASQDGWKNASALEEFLAKIPKRDVPQHAIIIEMGNIVTKLLNKQAALEGSVKLDPLSRHVSGHAAEAINRCLHLVFEYGKAPEGHDPLNYLLIGQIISRLSTEADERLLAKN